MKRRSIAKFQSHFAGTRMVSKAALAFAMLIPACIVAVITFAVIAHVTGGPNNPFAFIIAPLAALGSYGAALLTLKVSWKSLATVALAIGLAAGGGGQQPDPAVVNAAARSMVLSQSVEMEQQIFSAAINLANQNVVPIVPRNVGLIKRFRVVITGNVQNTDGANDAVRTPFGIGNVVQNVQFYDLQNNIRINTTGWHLTMLQAAKYRDPYNSSLVANDFLSPTAATSTLVGNFGNNFPVAIDLNGLTHGTNQNFRHTLEVPLAYSDDDLRGGIYANVVNATMNLQITLTPSGQAFVATGADDTAAVLRGGTCSYNGNITVTVYQVYLDQIPQGKNGAVLPILDLSTVYEIKNTTFQNLVANQEFPVPYSNFRDFLSTFLVYNNSGSNTGHGNGTDINYFTLQSANFTNIWKLDPLSLVERSRKLMTVDFPAGTYYLSFRRKPISTVQYGNMQTIINPITAGAGNYLLVGFEAFALQNVITQAGSLSAA